MCDDNRPTLTLTYPQPGVHSELTRLLIGMHDYYAGLERDSFSVSADFEVDGIAAGQNLAARFRPTAEGVWELKPTRPIRELARGTLTIAVKDRQGNTSRLVRTFSVAAKDAPRVPR